MRIEDVTAFVLVVDSKGFSRAAESLRLTQPALSQRVRKLERSLGAELIDRNSRAGRPTAMGLTFLPIARRMLADFDRAHREMRDIVEMRRGVVACAANFTAVSTVVPEILAEFALRRPEIEVRIEEDSTPPVLEKIIHGYTEFGIVNDHNIPDELSFEALVDDELVVVCHRDHPLAARSAVTWRDLQGQPFIHLGPRAGTRRRIKLLAGGLEVKNAYQVNHALSAIALARRNLGLTVAPRLACADLPPGDVAVLPVGDPTIRQRLGIAVARGRTLSPAAADLVSCARRVLRALAERHRPRA